MPPPECLIPFQRPLTLLCIGSLANNAICSVTTRHVTDQLGTYTTEGIIKLCEGLKGSALTSLRCALWARVFVSAPVDTPTLSLFPSCPYFAVSEATTSEPRAPLRWLP